VNRPPRERDEKIVRRKDLLRMARESGIITAGSMAGYVYGWLRYGPGPQANTLAFNSVTLAQLFHAYACRSEHHSIYSEDKLPPNPWLTRAIGGSVALQLLAMFVPGIRNFLGATRIGLLDGAVIVAGASLPMLINEGIKQAGIRADQLMLDQDTGRDTQVFPDTTADNPREKRP
jgi:Ca2+-transporting ATPase